MGTNDKKKTSRPMKKGQFLAPERSKALNSAMELFFFAHQRLVMESDEILASLSLGRVHHRILYFIAHRKGITISDLLLILNVSRQGLHRPLKQLIDVGYVASTPTPQNRRVHFLTLTTRGAMLESKISGMQKAMLHDVFAACSPESEMHWRKVMALLGGRPPEEESVPEENEADQATAPQHAGK